MKKINLSFTISRQYIYLSLLSLFLLIFVFVFSFAVLIPEGKEYRKNRIEYKKELKELRRFEEFEMQTAQTLKELQSKNRHIISAFDTIFNPERFEKEHKKYFSSLTLSAIKNSAKEDGFAVYEVNTSSKINSPVSFYDFLDALNKSSWIVGVNFPIEFKRDGELIHSSFTMKVYANAKDSNTSKASTSEAK